MNAYISGKLTKIYWQATVAHSSKCIYKDDEGKFYVFAKDGWREDCTKEQSDDHLATADGILCNSAGIRKMQNNPED